MYIVRCDAPYIPPHRFHLYLLGLLPFTTAWQLQCESYNLPNNSQDNVTLLQAVYGAENTTFSPAPPWVPVANGHLWPSGILPARAPSDDK